MARYSIDISNDVKDKLDEYMRMNNISKKSVAIKRCINDAVDKDNLKSLIYGLDSKLNRLLHREKIDRKLVEQLFSNMGFQINETIKDDSCLKEFYKSNDNFIGGIGA